MAQIEQVADVVEQNPQQVLIVTSAPGRLEPDDAKITDLLIDYSQNFSHDGSVDTPESLALRDQIMDRFNAVFYTLPVTKAVALSNKLNTDLKTAEDPSYIISRGEYYAARTLADLLNYPFHDADFIRFDKSGELDRAATALAVRQLGPLSVYQKKVVPGFYGFDDLGDTHLLGRGGSDRSGAIPSNILGMDYENWTDQDGIFTADPRKVPGARVRDELTNEEVREGAHGGAGVLQGDTILDLNGSGVTTTIRNTFNLSAPGTRVLPQREVAQNESIVAFSCRDDLTEINVRDMGMADARGYTVSLLKEFGNRGFSIQHMPQSQDSFSITTVAETERQQAEVDSFVEFVKHRLKTATGSVEAIPRGVVYAIGEGLRDPFQRTAAQIRMLGEISVQGMAVQDIVSSPTSPSVAMLVRPEDAEPIMRALHRREIEKIL